MNGAKVPTVVALLLLDLVWFQFVRHRFSGVDSLGAYEMASFVFSGYAARSLPAVLKCLWLRMLEALP